jgi:hypothetical protein
MDLRFIVEVWHLPSVLLVIVVVSVGRVVRRGNALRVRCWCSVIEIHLK